jgi:hypothetical protein
MNSGGAKTDWVKIVSLVFEAAGLVVLIFYTRAAYLQISQISQQSGTMTGQLDVMRGQLSEMKSSSEQTERAIKASNRIADASAQSVAASNRLANAAAQSTAESRRLADAANEANAVSRRLADASIEANAVSRRLADSAAQSTEINRQALVAVQRPFMFVKDVDFVKFLDPQSYHARVIWENTGNTPTRDLIIENGCVFSDTPIDDPYATPEAIFWGQKSPQQLNKQQLFVGPKQSTYALGCLVPTLLVVFDQILMSRILIERHFYLMGRAQYRDTFNPDYVHVTEYCRVVVDMKFDDKLSKMTADTFPCVAHNCADEECKRKPQAVPSGSSQ